MYRTDAPELTKAGLRQAIMREVCATSCLHFVGNDEFYGKPFAFEDWQHDVWRPIFGCGDVDPATGLFRRRYDTAIVGLKRVMGKTHNASAMMLAEATMNPIHNGEYGIIADSKPNAQKAFSTLTAMVRTSPQMNAIWECHKSEVTHRWNGSWIRVFPNDEGAVQGYHFNFCICDELHVYRDDRLWHAVTSGQSGIPNALTVGITTASGSREGFLWDELTSVRNGEKPNCYLYWIGIDDDDDPDDRRCWSKVMVSPRVTMDELERLRAKLGKRDFMRYHLNYFPPDLYEEPFVEAEAVEDCRGVEETLDRDEWYAVGVDAAPSGDDTAVVAAQQRPNGTWAFREWVWPGTRADFSDLADVLDEIARDPGGPTIVIDPNRLKLVKDWLWNYRGIDLFDMAQTPKVMCPASELLRRTVRKRRAALANVPVLARHLKNAVSVESKAYGDRISSTGHGPNSARIDAAVAAAMAMSFYDGNVDEHAASSTFLVPSL